MSKFPYVFPPMTNQVRALKRAWPKREFALFHEMGTGKTFTAINLAAGRYRKEMINAMVVICPTAVKPVWELELEKICPVPYTSFTMTAGSNNKVLKFINYKSPKLKILILGSESLSQGKAGALGLAFAREHNTMVVVDESSDIKNYGTMKKPVGRTHAAIKIGNASDFRMIMTGTPITQGVEDLWSQFMFLNPRIIGCDSFFVFKNKYCITGGFQGKKILGYQFQDELMDRIAPYVDQAYKKDVLDLPDKVYQKRVVQCTTEQMAAIKQLKELFEADVEGDILTTGTVLTRLTRYQQIIGGNFPFDEVDGMGFNVKPMPGQNPKMMELMRVLEEIPPDASVVIWARFVPEIELIANSIRHEYETPLLYYGPVDDVTRKQNIIDFEAGKNRFFISNQATGGMGLTLVKGTYVIYYSNSFSYKDRVQSEDRCHRKGQVNKVTYIDIEMDHPHDRMIMKAVQRKGGLAKVVNEELERRQK